MVPSRSFHFLPAGAPKSCSLPSRHGFCFGGSWISFRLRKGQTGGRNIPPEAAGRTDMFRQVGLALAAMLIMVGAAWADPIEGNWKTEAGATAAITGSDGAFSI